MSTKLRKAFSFVLALITVLCLVPSFHKADAATIAWPEVKDSKYIEFYADKYIPVYRRASDTKLYTNGTIIPPESYSSAAIYKNDKCYIHEIICKNGWAYLRVSYPVTGGRKEGYIYASAVFGNNLRPSENVKSKGEARSVLKTRAGAQYPSSYVEKNDNVYAIQKDSSYVQIIYPSKYGNRAYKLAWVTKADYENIIIKGQTSDWDWPMNNAYICGNDWMTRYWSDSRPDRPYHLGLDMYSRAANNTRDIKAAANGTIKAVGRNGEGGNGNGYYVVIEHNINGKTYYSFYAHLASKSNKTVGQTVNKGDIIGTCGSTGTGTGVHLHFAITDKYWSNGSYYGYGPYTSGNSVVVSGTTFYNPKSIITAPLS